MNKLTAAGAVLASVALAVSTKIEGQLGASAASQT